MRTVCRQPAAWAMGLALAVLTAAVSAEDVKPESAAPAQTSCDTGEADAKSASQPFVANSAAAVRTEKGSPRAQNSAAPPPVAANTPRVHITISGSNFKAGCPSASGTVPAEPAAQATRATKTRSNIQNN